MPAFKTPDGLIYVCPACFDGFHDVCFRKAETTGVPGARRATVLAADKANEFLAPAWTCRSDALTRDSGWRATMDLTAGLSRTAAWYRAEGWL